MRTPPDHNDQGPDLTKRIGQNGHEMPGMQGMHKGHGGHGWMMIACCIPMLVIAVVLVATGVLSVGFLVLAVACTAMMAMMMRGMNHDGPS